MFTQKILPLLLFHLVCLGAIAQVSSDSVTSLKQQKQYLELSSKLNEHKIQLAKLENAIEKKTREADDAADDARRAADDNSDAAAKLSNSPQDKSSAKKARKSANNAEGKAKKARKAADDLAGLRKDIENLRNKIADDESKLAAAPGGPVPSQQNNK